MRPLFGILTLLALLTGCSSQYTIDGNSSLSCLDGKRLYLRVPQMDTPRAHYQTIDSCEGVHGRFRFGGGGAAARDGRTRNAPAEPGSVDGLLVSTVPREPGVTCRNT